MELKTYLAVGELVQAAAHLHGVTGPVMFTVSETDWCGNCGDCDQCRDDEYPWCDHFDTDDYEPPTPVDMLSIDELDQEEEFFYAQSFC